MSSTRAKQSTGAYISDFLTGEGINNPINRSIIHILQNEKSMLYSDLVMNLGISHTKFATHIGQLINKNIINRDINTSRLSLNMPYIKDKGYKI